MKRPFGISLISYFYIFGSLVLLFTSILYDADANQIGIAERFGLPTVPEQLMRVLVAVSSLVIIFGYMRLKRWGFWLMIIYSVLFGTVSFYLSSSDHKQPFIGNMSWSIIILLYTIYARKAFFQNEASVTRL